MHAHFQPDVTILIPQYNREELTINCIRSIRRHEPTLWPIVVIDDGSRPEAVETLQREHFPAVQMLTQEHTGITRAWNRGAANALTPLLLFLNNDVEASGPFVESLLQPLRAGAALITGPQFRRESAYRWERFLEGWCLATTRELWLQLRGFDEEMKLYFSDTDFQLRARGQVKNSQQLLTAVSGLPLHHRGHQTAHALPNRSALWKADREDFLRKWGRA